MMFGLTKRQSKNNHLDITNHIESIENEFPLQKQVRYQT